jgi:hypothetical protein
MDYSKIRATWWIGVCYHKSQLDEIISSTDIKSYAWILHDKDKQPNSDGLKKPHYHFLVQFYGNQRGAWFKRFATDDMGIVLPNPSYAPQGAYDYLIHDTPNAKKEGKFLYNPSERIGTIENLEPDETALDESAELHSDIEQLLCSKMTWAEFIKKKPKRIYSISNIRQSYNILYMEMYGKPPNDGNSNSNKKA